VVRIANPIAKRLTKTTPEDPVKLGSPGVYTEDGRITNLIV